MTGFESIGESGRYEVSGRMVRFAVASALKDGVSDEEAVSELLDRWRVRAVGAGWRCWLHGVAGTSAPLVVLWHRGIAYGKSSQVSTLNKIW